MAVKKHKVDYKPRTAADVIAPYADNVDGEGQEMAAEAGVAAAAYVDYGPALKNYEGRTDIETLKRRRARENGETFEAASFRREVKSQEEGLLTTDTVVKPSPAAGKTEGADSKGDNPKEH